MKLNANQTTHLQQQLALTPSMRLALEILQKPHLELKALIELEVQENPLLELEEEASDRAAQESTTPAVKEESETPAAEEPFTELDDNLVDALVANDPSAAPAAQHDEDERLIESRSDKQPSLHAHLCLQLGCLPLTPVESAIGALLIEHLDEHGYLISPVEELAELAGVSSVEIERVLGIVQAFDPPGVGARDLQECLLLQLRHQGHGDSLAARIVRDHLPLFLQQQLKRLAVQCDRPLEEIEAACHAIRQLNPKPYRSTAVEAPATAADLCLRLVDGRYEIELEDDDLPHVTISTTYRRMLRNPETPEEVRKFLKDRLRQAVWFLRAVEQRHATLLAIAHCIMELQDGFLTQGPRALKPLTQAQVAAVIGRHPSTVGRAIAGKHIDTPYGLIPLERFFASRVPQERPEESLSDAKIKGELETLIAEEDPAHPLSDEAITRTLHARHMQVARRTVAKYRAELKVLPAYLRRRASMIARQERARGRTRLAADALPSQPPFSRTGSLAPPAEESLRTPMGNGPG